MTGEATNVHYDQQPEIFEAFLDTRMKYTCGIYPTGNETLNEAQEIKLHTVAELLGLSGDERVLDIGSGWGSMVCHLAGLGCHVTGVTPSANQADYIRNRAGAEGVADRVVIDQSSFADTDLGTTRFDAVTIVGVVEAIPDLDGTLRKIARHLCRRGRVYLSATCFRSRTAYDEFSERPGTRFVTEDVFGWGVLRPLSELVTAFEDARLSVIGCYDLTAHYKRTIQQWIDRIDHRRATIERLRPGYADELIRYFEIANAGWGHTSRHYGLVATRSRDGEAITPTHSQDGSTG